MYSVCLSIYTCVCLWIHVLLLSMSLSVLHPTPLPFSITNFLSISRPLCPPPSHLVCSHLALGTLVRLQALTERSLNRLHFSGNGLEGLLIMLLPLQGFIQTLLLLADLRSERKGGKEKSKGCELERKCYGEKFLCIFIHPMIYGSRARWRYSSIFHFKILSSFS